MKKLPIGKQEFSAFHKENFLYVDKTKQLLTLAESSVPIFLSRPRRFGKSLTTNTLKELFLGNKELFLNTFAYDNWDFNNTYTVLKMDLSTVTGKNREQLNNSLVRMISKIARQFKITLPEDNNSANAFDDLIYELSEQENRQIVILIDEYDTPILDNIKNNNLDELKELLRDFFKILKSNEKNIRFLFITGISKFSQVSIFSALNHPDDITLNSKYASLLGYTQNEIKHYFSEYIDLVKKKYNLSETVFWEKLQKFYNGYSWDGKTFLYNPFSILKFFNSGGEFRPYWMATGIPSFIAKYSKQKQILLETLENIKVTTSFLDKNDIDNASTESFLFQAGYLTIKEYSNCAYTLKCPNEEVRSSIAINRQLI